MPPLVSVIIPTRNRHDFLREAVASVAAQTHPEVECIVVDDGSDEPVETAAREGWVGRPAEMLKVIRQERANGNVARNRGLDESRGEFIQFLDSDDYLLQKKLERQIAILDPHRDLDAVVCRIKVIGPAGLLVDHRWAVSSEVERPSVFDLLNEKVSWQTMCPLWRRSAFGCHHLRWDPTIRIAQDWLFHVDALARGANVKFVNDHVLACYRIPEQGNVSYGFNTIEKVRSLHNTITAIRRRLLAAKIPCDRHVVRWMEELKGRAVASGAKSVFFRAAFRQIWDEKRWLSKGKHAINSLTSLPLVLREPPV